MYPSLRGLNRCVKLFLMVANDKSLDQFAKDLFGERGVRSWVECVDAESRDDSGALDVPSSIAWCRANYMLLLGDFLAHAQSAQDLTFPEFFSEQAKAEARFIEGGARAAKVLAAHAAYGEAIVRLMHESLDELPTVRVDDRTAHARGN